MALVAVIGVLLTALGFGIGTGAWELVVLAAFVVTLLGRVGGQVRFAHIRVGDAAQRLVPHRARPTGWLQARPVVSRTWALVLAWLAGSARWIAFACFMWFARGRHPRPEPVPEIPWDVSPPELTRPIILFAVIWALARTPEHGTVVFTKPQLPNRMADLLLEEIRAAPGYHEEVAKRRPIVRRVMEYPLRSHHQSYAKTLGVSSPGGSARRRCRS